MTTTFDCLFCEDIREEVGNKPSLMGVFGPSVQVLSPTNHFDRLSFIIIVHFSDIAENKDILIKLTRSDDDSVIFETHTPKLDFDDTPNLGNTLDRAIDRGFVGKINDIGFTHGVPLRITLEAYLDGKLSYSKCITIIGHIQTDDEEGAPT